MTKITFIGGGSVQWIPGLMSDIALTPTLDGSEIVLHDISVDALKVMVPVCRRIAAHHGADICVTGTVEREKALRNADFVVLCVAIGGLDAMRDDLEIPAKYGINQSVGDTVGPGGMVRGLRHIPFALEVARDMERLCPDAWMLNLTNPMTTICRAVTKATSIRTIGLCHEVAGLQIHLAKLFNLPEEAVIFEIAGINHLPVITRCRIGDEDGFERLRDWLKENDPADAIGEQEMQSVFEVFTDTLALKLSLFQDMGVLFGAGDRHVAEFLPGILSAANDEGWRYGIRLTTYDHRMEMLTLRSFDAERYTPPDARSREQLAPLMAALLDGPTGRFVVNVPNVGQIDNLPREATVECTVHADALGIRPLTIGELLPAAYAVVAPHVARQELIVEAALSGRRELAVAAMATDPLVDNPQIAPQLFAELIAATDAVLARAAEYSPDVAKLDAELDVINAQAAPQPRSREAAPTAAETDTPKTPKFSVHHTPIRDLIDNEASRAVMEKHFADMIDDPRLSMAASMTLASAARYAPKIITKEKLAAVEKNLQTL